jgi:hypothetical protein
LTLALAGCQGGGTEQQSAKSAGEPDHRPPAIILDPKGQSADNLRRIALAMKEYARDHGYMPGAAYLDPGLRERFENVTWPAADLARQDGKFTLKGRTVPLFSWRVALLPYLGEEDLSKQLAMDEPWDSEQNKKLLARVPAVYATVAGEQEKGLTYYQVFVGQETPFNGMEPPRYPSKFIDGTFSTFLVVEAAEPVPWTRPQDVPYDSRKPLPKLGGLFADGFHAAMADGTVRFVSRGAPEELIRAAITPSGGELPEPPGELVK